MIGSPLSQIFFNLTQSMALRRYLRRQVQVRCSRQPTNKGDQNGSHGTLMLSKGGRTKYLGPTAGSEWLRDVGAIVSKPSKKLSVSSRKLKTLLKHPLVTRAPSPQANSSPRPANTAQIHNGPIAFPFNASSARIRTRDLLVRLPPRDQAWELVISCYRYCAWQ